MYAISPRVQFCKLLYLCCQAICVKVTLQTINYTAKNFVSDVVTALPAICFGKKMIYKTKDDNILGAAISLLKWFNG